MNKNSVETAEKEGCIKLMANKPESSNESNIELGRVERRVNSDRRGENNERRTSVVAMVKSPVRRLTLDRRENNDRRKVQ